MQHCYANWPLLLEYVKALLDFLKVFFGWPVAALILGLMFIKVFKPDIADFLKRVTKIKGPGTELEAPITAVQAQAAQSAPVSPADPIDPIDQLAADPVQAKQAISMLKEAFLFEQAFNLIFGTQMTLLHVLRSLGVHGADAAVAEKNLQDHIALIGVSPPPTLDTYLSFLFARGIVSMSNGRLVITDFGNRFVDHIVKSYSPPPFRAF